MASISSPRPAAAPSAGLGPPVGVGAVCACWFVIRLVVVYVPLAASATVAMPIEVDRVVVPSSTSMVRTWVMVLVAVVQVQPLPQGPQGEPPLRPPRPQPPGPPAHGLPFHSQPVTV